MSWPTNLLIMCMCVWHENSNSSHKIIAKFQSVTTGICMHDRSVNVIMFETDMSNNFS